MPRKTFSEGLVRIETTACTAALLPRPGSGVVSLIGAVHAGPWHAEVSKDPLAGIAASLLDEGTRSKSRELFRTSLEEKGIKASFWANDRYLFFSILSTKTAFPEAYALVMEALAEPLLSPAACDEVIAREAAERIHASENTRSEAASALSRLLYVPGSPGFHEPALTERAVMLSLKRADILSFIEKSYRGRIIISAVGDIIAHELEKLLDTHSSSWDHTPGASGRTPSALEVSSLPRESYISIPGKESIDVYMGSYLPMPPSDPLFTMVRVAVDLLGGGFSDHLSQTIRDRDGLTYGTYARISGKENGSGMSWSLWAMFGNTLYEKGKAALQKELEIFLDSGITDVRLKEKTTEIHGRLSVLFSSHRSAAWEILSGLLATGNPNEADLYAEKVSSLSADDVNQIARKYLRIDAIAAAGSLDKKGKILKK